MESAQRELMIALLGHVFSLGLISKTTYSKAVDLVYSMAALPEFFSHPVCPAEEADRYECAPDTQ